MSSILLQGRQGCSGRVFLFKDPLGEGRNGKSKI
jgi:hypothetical protein